MSGQEPSSFNFWWPTSETGKKVMFYGMYLIGFLLFIKGCDDENLGSKFRFGVENGVESVISILFFHVALGVVGWYFIINFSRLAYTHINDTETMKEMKETRHEKAELEALRRRKEIKKLKEELGDDINDEANS